MNIFILDGDINKESFYEFQEFSKGKYGDHGIVYINSGGGSSFLVEAFVNLLNRIKTFDVVCINAQSAAFDIFVKCKNKKIVSNYFMSAMTHHSEMDVSIVDIRTNRSKFKTHDMCVFDDHERIFKLESDEARELLNDDEMIEFDRGDYVYLSYNRMNEIVKSLNIKNGHE